MSAKFRAAAFRPMSLAVDQSRRKCRFSTRRSVDATTRPSGVATTAASSPGPTTVDAAGRSPEVTLRIRPNSPRSAIVLGSEMEPASSAYSLGGPVQLDRLLA
jgi:hypothetical protein